MASSQVDKQLAIAFCSSIGGRGNLKDFKSLLEIASNVLPWLNLSHLSLLFKSTNFIKSILHLFVHIEQTPRPIQDFSVAIPIAPTGARTVKISSFILAIFVIS